MKGLEIADAFWTLIFFIVIMVLVILGVFIWLQIHLPLFSTADPISYSIEFVHVANKPYLLTEVLAHTRLGDRQVLEQAIESIASSLENAQATDLPSDLEYYVKNYNLKEYYISISRPIASGQETLLSVESIETKCGNNVGTNEKLEGWCVFSECGVGRIEINQPKVGCISAYQKCCKDVTIEEYAANKRPNDYPAYSCGPQGEGVCSEGVRPAWASVYELFWGTYYAYECEQNRIDLGNPPECRDVNNGNTRACCVPKTEEKEVDTGLATRVVVPLLYKDFFGTLEVTAR